MICGQLRGGRGDVVLRRFRWRRGVCPALSRGVALVLFATGARAVRGAEANGEWEHRGGEGDATGGGYAEALQVSEGPKSLG